MEAYIRANFKLGLETERAKGNAFYVQIYFMDKLLQGATSTMIKITQQDTANVSLISMQIFSCLNLSTLWKKKIKMTHTDNKTKVFVVNCGV